MLYYNLLPWGAALSLFAVAAPQPEVREKAAEEKSAIVQFDLNRYLGEWYEIARFDHRFERGLTHVRAFYRLRDDGKIDVVNSGFDPRLGQRREAHGKARTTDVPGELEVSFFWIFYAPYRILALDPEYEWSLVGSRSPKYLWILSRTPQLPAPTLERILGLARAHGYDTSQLIFVDQSAEKQSGGS